MPSLIIFGNGQAAQLAHYYFSNDSSYTVEGFTVDAPFLTSDTLEGLPVYAVKEVLEKFPPADCTLFVAMGYRNMNRLRAEKYTWLKKKGYTFANYISSKCTWLSQNKPGENCLILEDNTIQPFSQIGNNVVLWSGNHIGHHSKIEDHCFITSHVVVSGNVTIGHHSFLGVNASIGDGLDIAPFTLAGAGVTLIKNTTENGVYVPEKATLLHKKSQDIL